MKYGSDLMAELIASLKIPYIAFNPGATFRGLHDSLVNHPSCEMPEIIECTHEEISVSVAHGYAKATGTPMASALHNVVGLQHASMAIYNAWCDRVPIMLFGGTGPMNVEDRRPGTDWIHTALIQGNIVRDYVKWDDQPSSLHSLQDSIYRAYKLAITEPTAPVYVNFDAGLQEQVIQETDTNQSLLSPDLPDPKPYVNTESPAPSLEIVKKLADVISKASWPVIVTDNTTRSNKAFDLLQTLANKWAIPVIDKGSRLNLPTNHFMNLSYDNHNVLAKADVVIALDVLDIYGTVSKTDRVNRTTQSVLQSDVRVFQIGLKDFLVRSWSHDFQRLFPTENNVLADTSFLLEMLLNELNLLKTDSIIQAIQARYQIIKNWHLELRETWEQRAKQEANTNELLSSPGLAYKVWETIKDEDFILANGNLQGWTHRIFTMDKNRQYLGKSGGGGLGYGIGATIGACLAHRNTDKLIVNIQSDGDLLFTPGGLWTLAHHKLPALIIMNNNRSYYNSEEHQKTTARKRGRDEKRAVIGTLLEDPNVNFAQLAQSMGVVGIGPIEKPSDIDAALKKAIQIIKTEKRPVLVDIITDKMSYR
ncbi:thiamine pyrophosphate-binding protein [Bacillus sp. Marseille-P3661]|uniref:thiamine pyrophosphate-binding protein n=1 Tax=Bacillus sp. Marseille-P3661 TaxID=1936234 RepID=UPI000C82BB55|nr:thiamine pyrophosphate-dependent enzyme [Bacillus sp. Marseille-P3661]